MIPTAVAAILLLASSPLQPLEVRLEQTAYLTGSFRQVDRWALTLEEETSHGALHLAHPNLFLLVYTDPAGWKSGFDGSVLYSIEADVEQVFLYPSSEPGSFLHLISRAADCTDADTVSWSADSLTVRLRGDLGEGITEMTVGYTLSDSLPFLFQTRDANGNLTRYDIWDMETADASPTDIFQLVVPEGFTVVEPGSS